ncbi:hypothetical protein ACQ27_gp177 [Klebsiella phage K64-1]|uniref:hypothetical protein n=1 Tax=Klebsiella phage K64-1 TaxID=1439894 RepID=UPI00248CEB30|nr:hypothetical protein ACQ27_gp177 [Klebsiella phage K64-1]
MKDNVYIYIIKVLEGKGYNINEVIKKSDKEIKSLPLSRQIIEGIISYKEKGSPKLEEIEKKIFDKRYNPDVEVKTSDIIEYVKNTDEQNEVLDNIKQEQLEEIPDDVIVIKHTAPNKEDLDIIKDALQQKELRTIAKYVKHLKDTVPSAIMSAVDSVTINDLINARIAEVKSAEEKTK